MKLKTCTLCKEKKSLSEYHYHKQTKDNLQTRCKVCIRKVEKERYGPEKRDRTINTNLKKRFGISLQYYDDLFEKQNGLCAICNGPSTDNKRLHIDHDHTTGKLRELLCARCNLGIGHFNDQIDVLAKAIQYLIKHKEI